MRGIPFEVKLPENRPIALGALTQEEFDAEIEKGMADIENGRFYSAEEVEAEFVGYALGPFRAAP